MGCSHELTENGLVTQRMVARGEWSRLLAGVPTLCFALTLCWVGEGIAFAYPSHFSRRFFG